MIRETTGGAFSKGGGAVVKKLIALAVETTGKCTNYDDALLPKAIKENKELVGRIDVTEETSTVSGQKTKILKLQVQRGSETYSSVMIRRSAIDFYENKATPADSMAFAGLLATTIGSSYKNEKVYEIVYE